MQPLTLLVIYSLLSVIGSFAGGLLPIVVRLTHRHMQIAISFVSGVILGIGLLHLLPHAYAELGSIDSAVQWALAGFLFMFFLERFFHFHHHDVSDDAEKQSDAAHGHDHSHSHASDPHAHAHVSLDHDQGPAISVRSWMAAVIGLSLHGLIDGVALVAAVHAEADEGLAWAGLGTALAVTLHKPFDSLTIGALLAASGQSVKRRLTVNLLYALVTPLGVVLCVFAAHHHSEVGAAVGPALGFAAGSFVCIATSDLLPELHFHRHDRVGLSVALLAGIALAWSTGLLETHGHDAPRHNDGHEKHEGHESHLHLVRARGAG